MTGTSEVSDPEAVKETVFCSEPNTATEAFLMSEPKRQKETHKMSEPRLKTETLIQSEPRGLKDTFLWSDYKQKGGRKLPVKKKKSASERALTRRKGKTPYCYCTAEADICQGGFFT